MATSNQMLAIDRLNKWFTPNKPIDVPEILSGRMQLIYRVTDAINTEGQHMFINGKVIPGSNTPR